MNQPLLEIHEPDETIEPRQTEDVFRLLAQQDGQPKRVTFLLIESDVQLLKELADRLTGGNASLYLRLMVRNNAKQYGIPMRNKDARKRKK